MDEIPLETADNTPAAVDSDPARCVMAIEAAGAAMASVADDAGPNLVTAIWPAMYAYCLASDCDSHQALAAATSWACDFLRGDSLHANEEPPGGRWRRLYWDSAQTHLSRCRTHGWDKVATPVDATSLSLDDIHPMMEALVAGQDPASAFTRAWGACLVLRALRETRQACGEERLDPHWKVLQERVIEPRFKGGAPASWHDLLVSVDVSDSAAAAMMMVDVQRRIGRRLRDLIGQTLDHVVQVDPEINILLSSLTGDRPASAVWAILEWSNRVEHETAMLAADLIASDLGAADVEALFRDKQSLAVLTDAKDCYKTMRLLGDKASDRRLGGELYVATIAAALVHYDERISRQGDLAVEGAFTKICEERSLPAPVRDLVARAAKHLRP